MKKKKKDISPISTFLGNDTTIEGVIEFKGSIRLDGHVKGEILGKTGTVIIGKKAVVKADITVDIAIIMGEVNGTINAMDRIEVFPPGRVDGDIQAPVISIGEGVMFNGNCIMNSHTTSSSSESKEFLEKMKNHKSNNKKNPKSL